ncbi:MAG: hypothetical protein AB7U45_08990 [Desulfamplus sp.]
MIFFCEDCGARNSLTDESIQQGIVTFRCKVCNYLNSYPLPGTTRQNAGKMPLKENIDSKSCIKNR